MKRKYINRSNWEGKDIYLSRCIHVDDVFSGYISLIKVDKVKQKITVAIEYILQMKDIEDRTNLM